MDFIFDCWILTHPPLKDAPDGLAKEGNRKPAISLWKRGDSGLSYSRSSLKRADPIKLRVSKRDANKCPHLAHPVGMTIYHHECGQTITETNCDSSTLY
jgi:hypothetical protein